MLVSICMHVCLFGGFQDECCSCKKLLFVGCWCDHAQVRGELATSIDLCRGYIDEPKECVSLF